MKYLFPICILLILVSCGEKAAPTPASLPPVQGLEGYQMSAISGSAIQRAVKKDEAGLVLEDGYVLNDKRTGTWLSYHTGENRVKSITTYVEGLKNGRYITMSNRGQVELEANYKDDILNGPWVSYKFGSRKSKEVFYNMGVMDRYYREYHSNGKLMKDAQYKDGKMHGYFKQYSDKDELVMEYEYNMGEKVSGGIVESDK